MIIRALLNHVVAKSYNPYNPTKIYTQLYTGRDLHVKLEISFEKIIGYYCVLLIVIVWLFLFAKS